MKTVVNTNSRATTMHKLRKIFGDDALIFEANLRVDKPLAVNVSSYEFELENTRNENTPEIKLNTQDLFVPVSWALKLAKVPDGVNENIANSVLVDYPDLSIFSGAGEAKALEAVYNATMSSKSNSNEVFDFVSTVGFRRVPQTQGAAGLTLPQTPNCGHATRTFFSRPIYQGSARNIVTVNLKNVDSAINVAGSTNYLVLYLDGFYVRGIDQSVTQMQLQEIREEGFIFV